MSEINIEELERLAKAAAPGPWCRRDFHSSGQKNGVDDSDGDVVCASYSSLRPKSFDFIAAANPSAVLALIDRVKKAEAQQAGPARLTDNDVVDLFQTWNTTYGTSHADLIRAVETAVLERNGLKPIPTAVTIAPRGYSFHGGQLQKDELGTLTRKPQAKGDCNG